MKHLFLPLAALLAASLSAALTWPAPLHMGEAVLGSPDSDAMKHVWTLWWIREMLTGGALPFETDYVNFPSGMELYPIEPLNGLVASALFGVGIVAAANGLALLNLTLTGICGAWFGRELSGGPEEGSPWAGLAAGVILQSSSFALFTIHVGVGELQHFWWLPLGFGWWIRTRRAPTLPRALALAAAMIGASLSCFYHGFFLAVGVATLSLVTLWAGRGTPKLLAHYALAAGLGLAVVLPVTRSFSTSYGTDSVPEVGLKAYVLEEGHGQPVTDPPSARLDLPELIQPARDRRETSSREVMAYGGGRYLGWPALILALGALLLAPLRFAPWVLVGGLGVALSLGSYLVWGGEELINGLKYQMPFLFLNRTLGYLAEPLNFPVRALALTTAALAAGGALVAGRSFRGRSLGPIAAALALLNAVDVQRNQLIPRPMPSFELARYPGLEAMEPSPGAMVDLALAWRSDKETRLISLGGQIAHGERIQGVPLERIEYFAQEGQLLLRSMPFVAATEQAFYQQITIDRSEHAGELFVLREQGFDQILVLGVGPRREVPPPVIDALTSLFGAPTLNEDGASVFPIPEIEADAEQQAIWRAEHQARLDKLLGKGPRKMNPQMR